jgi:hypothetical protein
MTEPKNFMSGMASFHSYHRNLDCSCPWVRYREIWGWIEVALFRDSSLTPPGCRVPWNIHARYGGATEAREAGVGIEDIAEHARHTDVNTTCRHDNAEISRRVAKQLTWAGEEGQPNEAENGIAMPFLGDELI